MIHLPSIKTFVYTIPKHIGRQNNISEMLTKLDFTNWSFKFGKESQDPNPKNHWQAMHDDWIEMFNTPIPFLILEDDATLTEHYKPTIEYPLDANLVYLGGSSNGEITFLKEIQEAVNDLKYCEKIRKHQGWMVYSEYNDDYIRIYNMHSSHAMLFIDDYARLATQKALDTNRHMPTDLIFAYTMLNYKTYCVKRPLWYQQDGYNDFCTLNYY